MKTIVILIASLILAMGQLSAQITMPGVKWSDSYSFDRCNTMKIDFFAKNNELMRTFNYKTFYASGGKNFMVIMDAPAKGSDITTIIDIANEVAIQIYGSDSPEPMYNATRFKYPEGADIKKLELIASEETKTIAGHLCKKYTYTYKSIFGSAWITSEVKLSNDFGIFRAAKMSALHNTLSIEGFVMEMTSEDSRGGKTVMTTVSLENSENKTIDLPRAKMGTSMNKVNYYTF